MTTLAERIKIARELRGWTPNRLGVLAGLSQGMIYRLESGERTKRGSSGETITKIANALGVRSEWLLTGEDPMEATPVKTASNRELAAQIARDGGVHPEAVASVLVEHPEDLDKPALWWIEQMRRRELDLMYSRGPAAEQPTGAPRSGRRRKPG